MKTSRTTDVFTDKKGQQLIIKRNKSSIELFVSHETEHFDITDEKNEWIEFSFEKSVFKKVMTHLKETANLVWKNVNPRDAVSLESDYDEYYDKEYDDNGYMTVRFDDFGIKLIRPAKSHNRYYKLNKRKTETLIYTINQKMEV